MLARGRVEADVAQPRVDQRRPPFPASGRWPSGPRSPPTVGAVELLAIEQRHHGVAELHARNLPARGQVADGERVFARGGKVVQEADAAARAEGHAFLVDELRAGAVEAFGRQRDHHVGELAVGGGHGPRLRIAHGLLRHIARGGEILIEIGGRDLQVRGVVVEAVLARDRRGSSALTSTSSPSRSRTALAYSRWFRRRSGTRPGEACTCAASSRVSRKVMSPFDRFLVRTGLGAGRRHEACAQFAHGGFPHLRIAGQRVEGHRIECRATGPVGGVVAVVAVLLDEAPARVGFILRGRCLRGPQRARRGRERGQR